MKEDELILPHEQNNVWTTTQHSLLSKLMYLYKEYFKALYQLQLKVVRSYFERALVLLDDNVGKKIIDWLIPYRLSQSPSLLVCGSGSSYRPHCEGFIPRTTSNLQEKFSSCGFNPITNGFYWCAVNQPRPDHATLNFTWTVLIQIQLNCVFFASCISMSFYRLYSNTKLSRAFYLPPFEYFTKDGFSWEPRSEKTLPFVLSVRTRKFFSIFLRFLSWRVKTLQRARNVWRLNSQMLQDGTFFHHPIFVLKIPLFAFSYRIFFLLFVCFDILWQLATTHARDNKRHRDAKSSRQNGVTWCEFLQGKQVKLSPSRSLLPHKT